MRFSVYWLSLSLQCLLYPFIFSHSLLVFALLVLPFLSSASASLSCPFLQLSFSVFMSLWNYYKIVSPTNFPTNQVGNEEESLVRQAIPSRQESQRVREQNRLFLNSNSYGLSISLVSQAVQAHSHSGCFRIIRERARAVMKVRCFNNPHKDYSSFFLFNRELMKVKTVWESCSSHISCLNPTRSICKHLVLAIPQLPVDGGTATSNHGSPPAFLN